MAGMLGASRRAALRSISPSWEAEMPNARRAARRSAARSISSSTNAARSGPNSGELRASRRSGGPSPPSRLVSDGGSSTITATRLAVRQKQRDALFGSGEGAVVPDERRFDGFDGTSHHDGGVASRGHDVTDALPDAIGDSLAEPTRGDGLVAG